MSNRALMAIIPFFKGLTRLLQTNAHSVVVMDLSSKNVRLGCPGENRIRGA